VLIIEDQDEQRANLRWILTRDDRLQVVAEASSGQLGIELARQTKPDIVLVDVHLSDWDGFKVTRQILRERPQTKVIMNSADPSPTYEQAAFGAGAVALLPKRQINADAVCDLCFPDV
jgi:DNA-binding NarL/FixJ family response regulator